MSVEDLVENVDLEADNDDDHLEPRVPLHPDPELLDTDEKRYKYGILYLSYVPDGLNVKILREIMSEFGEVGRIYLEPEKNNKKHRTYTEGWIEFKKKRIAKHVAETLNGTPLKYGRKRCKMNGQIWSIEYLHKFKWVNLTEQLAHDNALREQRRKFEMTQARKEVSYYQKMTDISNKRTKKQPDSTTDTLPKAKIKVLEKRQKKSTEHGCELDVIVDNDLLSNIFKSVS